jgi:hypothetical protein
MRVLRRVAQHFSDSARFAPEGMTANWGLQTAKFKLNSTGVGQRIFGSTRFAPAGMIANWGLQIANCKLSSRKRTLPRVRRFSFMPISGVTGFLLF